MSNLYVPDGRCDSWHFQINGVWIARGLTVHSTFDGVVGPSENARSCGLLGDILVHGDVEGATAVTRHRSGEPTQWKQDCGKPSRLLAGLAPMGAWCYAEQIGFVVFRCRRRGLEECGRSTRRSGGRKEGRRKSGGRKECRRRRYRNRAVVNGCGVLCSSGV